MAITSANQLELLQTAEAVAREKMIDPALVVEAMEESLARAAKSRYGQEMDIRVSIDRKTGRATFTRVRTVADPEATDEDGEIIVNHQSHVTAEDAATAVAQQRPDVVVVPGPEGTRRFLRRRGTEADNRLAAQADQDAPPAIGDELVDEVPPVEMNRIAAQSAKQVILQKVREAERERQYEEFKDRAGSILNGVVKREEYGNVVIDIGRGEAVLRRRDKLPRESYRPNDRIRVYVEDVRREPRGPQIFLSRTHPEFMKKLFEMEVPEIYDGIIEIKAVARDPGSRAKIGVISYDGSIDPVGACVGMRGSRVQAVVNELQGEKIDIIQWSEDEATFIVNALAPAEVSKVVMDEEDERVEVVVPDEQLSLAIGRRGQNVRLASQLTGWQIDIMTESQESERRQR
ncbi:MAG: transcription termination factor NusA, partial [Hasllibacter sp.]